jgi:hypothetical protein
MQDELLGRRWIHSHEEDRDEEAVFRPASSELPPARGRRSFELRPDGSYVEAFPGPVDVPQETAGHWTLDGDRLALRPQEEGPQERWQVLESGEDLLRLRRLEA